ncbi:TonB-dependent receptor [Massilia sp. PAMC28688]|uniref:TonB-dependent receptor n=1 Tax=Massilia sp. PAMC28688 TaxID=2861283 RepID=UPI001C635BCE|nr:TonB-dependent receptor [Massilia sp. PAMC28688]QYF91814.1 TonB-dependent receptor [Massilia sp. PAMC28688]
MTGFRASLMQAQSIKKNSSSIVEAVSAEDIGKLPDTSIAETLARIPGLAGERVAGRTSGISVRGFKEDYVGTTLNGRELLGIGNNRGVEFDLYPAEIMSGAVVYKAPDASLSAMGIGGTVDLRTTRPLDAKPSTTLNASYEKGSLESNNPDFKNTGYRFAFADSRRFAGDTVGLAIALAKTNSPSQSEVNGMWGWSRNANFGDAYTPNGIEVYSRSQLLTRDTASAVLQFKPNNKVNVALDALMINFRDEGIRRGIIQALPDGTIGQVVNGVAQSGTSGPFNAVLRSDPTDKKGTLRTYGVNMKLAVNDQWQAKFDMAHSDTSKHDEIGESYAGNGRAGLATQGPGTTRSWETTSKGLRFSNNSINFADYNLVRLAGPQAWGGSLAPISQLQTSVSGNPAIGFAQAQDGFVNNAVFEESLDTVRLEAVGKLDLGWINAVNVGMLYSDHAKSKDNQGYYLTANTWPNDGPIPESARRGVADLSWAGLGQVVAYDAQGLINSGAYRRWDAQQLETDRLGDTYTIKEKVTTLFAKADFEGQLGSFNTFGNMGLQFINTRQSATGFLSVTGADLFVKATPVDDGANYTKVLPSLNVNFDLSNTQTVRFAASKAISRARIDQLRPGGSVRFINNLFNVTNPDPASGPWSSTTGNAKLRPNEVNQADLSYEWYFAKDGYVSVGGFYKDIVNWSRTGRQVVDFSQYYIPGYHQGVDTNGTVFAPATFQGIRTFFEDGLEGRVKGVELAATLPLRLVSNYLDGFGVVANAALTEGSFNDGTDIPGLSRDSYQLTAYYEKAGFSARVAATKRSSFLSEARGQSNSLTPANRKALTLVDAQVSYDFSGSSINQLKGMRLSFNAQNLTKQDDATIDTASGQVTQYDRYGARYELSLKYSF